NGQDMTGGVSFKGNPHRFEGGPAADGCRRGAAPCSASRPACRRGPSVTGSLRDVTADDLDRLWEVAERAAAAGARVVADAATRARDPARSKGAVGDYVTDADLASERAIRTVLERATPDIAVIAEESGGHAAERF